MFITELDAHASSSSPAEDESRQRNYDRRITKRDSSSTASDEGSYATAANSLQRQSSAETAGGLGISGHNSRTGSRQRMGSSSIISAAAAVQSNSPNWPGGIITQTDIRVESRELTELDAELRHGSQLVPREGGRWAVVGESERLNELTAFLRTVSPPPTNFMSVPSPRSGTTLSSYSSSIRRRNSRKKQGPLSRALGLLRSAGGKKKLSKNRPASPLGRSPSVKKKKKKKRPPRIRLPDTAVAGRTVDGFRHIAISIPIEHAHLGPEAPYRCPSWADRRTRSLSSADSSPMIYKDVVVRPMTAFVTEPHVGTQLGPLVEERESLSSTSWERSSNSIGGHEEAAAARKVRLASRNTFGTVHEEHSRPNTGAGLSSPPMPPRVSNESSEPETPRTSDEIRSSAHHRQALGALAGRPSTAPSNTTTTAATAGAGGGAGRPNSGYSFRSFATPSPTSRVYYPSRKSSLHPSAMDGGRRPRARTHSTHQSSGHSRDSSRDHTMQESIFSNPSYLESLDTVETELHPAPGVVISEATPARRFDGCDVVVCEGTPRRSMESNKRNSGESPRASAREKGKGREGEGEGEQGPVMVRRENRDSGGSIASAVATGRWSDPTPTAVTDSKPGSSSKMQDNVTRTTPQKPERRSRFVESIAEDPQPGEKGKGREEQDVSDQRSSRGSPRTPDSTKRKGKEVERCDGETRPRTPVRAAETTATKSPEEEGDQRLSRDHQQDTRFHDKSEQDVPEVRVIKPERTPRPKSKGTEKAPSPTRGSPETNTRESKAQREAEDESSSPLPSPQQRRERRKSTLLSRKQRIAELRQTLERPGSQPTDLLWERRYSLTSNSSSSSDESTPKANKARAARNTFPYPSGIPALAPLQPKTLPEPLSFTRVFTVADVQPSASPDLSRKGSLALSPSSPATIATVVKTSPIPPYRSLGSVTPPDSPPPSDSPTSHLSSGEAQDTPLQHLPSVRLKRINSHSSRRSGRGSPTSSGDGSRFPVLVQQHGNSPPRPKTAGKGALASRKNFFSSGRATTADHATAAHSPDSDLDFDLDRDLRNKSSSASLRGAPQQGKSVLKMSRSEIFERYEALRERQTREMEKRIRRLERNGEYWLTSMLPLLSDLSQKLGQLAIGKQEQRLKGKGQGKGKGRETEVGRERSRRGYGDGRQSRLSTRSMGASMSRDRSFEIDTGEHSDETFDRDETFVHHHRRAGRGGDNSDGSPERSRRLYLHDEPSWQPDLGYRVETRSFTDDGRHSFSLHAATFDSPSSSARRHHHQHHHHHRRARTTSSVITNAEQQLLLQQQQQYQEQHQNQHQASGSTTMVGSTTARANSLATLSKPTRQQQPHQKPPLPPSPLATETDRLARLEKLNERIALEMRSLSLSPAASAPSVHKSPAARDRAMTDAAAAAADDDDGGGGGGRRRRDAGFAGRERPVSRFSPDSDPSLDTCDGDDDDDDGNDDSDRQGARRGASDMFLYRSSRGSGMETIEPLMRELQITGSRLSMESEGTEDIADHEVRRMRQGPWPRAVVGFGAFNR